MTCHANYLLKYHCKYVMMTHDSDILWFHFWWDCVCISILTTVCFALFQALQVMCVTFHEKYVRIWIFEMTLNIWIGFLFLKKSIRWGIYVGVCTLSALCLHFVCTLSALCLLGVCTFFLAVKKTCNQKEAFFKCSVLFLSQENEYTS